MGVQTAGVGQNPDFGRPDGFGLQADFCLWPIESDAVCPHAKNRRNARTKMFDLFPHLVRTRQQFVVRSSSAVALARSTTLQIPSPSASNSLSSNGDSRRGVNPPAYKAGQNRFPGRAK